MFQFNVLLKYILIVYKTLEKEELPTIKRNFMICKMTSEIFN